MGNLAENLLLQITISGTLEKIFDEMNDRLSSGEDPKEVRLPQPEATLLGMKLVFDPSLKEGQFKIVSRKRK